MIDQFKKLPSVGPKTAQRFAYSLVQNPQSGDLLKLEEAIKKVRENIRICKNCFGICEGDLCDICSDPSRNKNIVCIIEEMLDIPPIEEATVFEGIYYVLGGSEKIYLKNLIEKIKNNPIEEIIIAFNPSAEGEKNALFLQKTIKENIKKQIKITRLGRGLPTGGDIKYADSETIRGAMLGRQNVNFKV